jgi:hypothetical protein
MMTAIRDFLRGYTEADVASATRKLEEHNLHPGCVIPLTGREMQAVVRGGLMPVFLHVRDVDRLKKLGDSINQRPAAPRSPEEK